MQETSFKKLITFLLGSYGLLNWNVVLNTINFFNSFSHNASFFNTFQFVYMFGSLISFLTSRLIFKKPSPYQFIIINMLISFVI